MKYRKDERYQQTVKSIDSLCSQALYATEKKYPENPFVCKQIARPEVV
jgi:hypothetical protein